MDNYLELTKKIGKFYNSDKSLDNDTVKSLLIKRAKIVASAVEIKDKLKERIQNYISDKHILVYCGATTINDIGYIESSASADEMRQIDVVSHILGNKLGMKVSRFTSEETSEERKQIQKNLKLVILCKH